MSTDAVEIPYMFCVISCEYIRDVNEQDTNNVLFSQQSQ